jgi:16S rRNA (guanine966-N2)-methyltransferase
MRIIAGLYKGRRLKTLAGGAIRPTADRLRETVFNILAPRIEGARFADLCAGSGAVGIEALSRGAAEVVTVEQSARAAAIIRANLAQCGIEEGVRLLQRPVLAALRTLAQEGRPFDLIYFDPPYDRPLYDPVLTAITESRLLSPEGLLLVEHRRSNPLRFLPDPIRPFREIIQGDSCLTFYRMEAVVGSTPESPPALDPTTPPRGKS